MHWQSYSLGIWHLFKIQGKIIYARLFLNCKYHLTYQSYKMGLPSSTTGHKETPVWRHLVYSMYIYAGSTGPVIGIHLELYSLCDLFNL